MAKLKIQRLELAGGQVVFTLAELRRFVEEEQGVGPVMEVWAAGKSLDNWLTRNREGESGGILAEIRKHPERTDKAKATGWLILKLFGGRVPESVQEQVQAYVRKEEALREQEKREREARERAAEEARERAAEEARARAAAAAEAERLIRTPGRVYPKELLLPGGVRLELVWCPPGTFMMGSPDGELGRCDWDDLHQVTLTRGFWIGKYPVTQEQWGAVMNGNPSNFKEARHPVENVSWNDIRKNGGFLGRLNGLGLGLAAGEVFRLPTEAEWEYACRAGTESALNSGKELTSSTGVCQNLGEVAWYNKNSGGGTHPVGQKKPNRWGIHDMHGNVWEWCEDWYQKHLGKQTVTDPSGPGSGVYRVNRGGSGYIVAGRCRSARRNWDVPGWRDDGLGFRLALSSSHQAR